MHLFSIVFLAALTLGMLVELWLIRRHQRHITSNKARVPEAFSDKITLEEHQKAADYSCAKLALGRIELIFGALVLIAWTLGGGINLLNTLWLNSPWGTVLTGIGLILSFTLVNGLIDLPFSVYRTFVLEARFGFNRTTPKRFVLDMLLQTLVGLALGIPLLWAVLWLMQEAGNYWWFAAWLVWISFMLMVTWLYPTVIAPLFNKFTPLQEGSLRERIDSLLERCGFASKGIFIMDGSRRSGHGNAYFTGFGRNKRIVFFDTLIETLEDPETEAVLAHELGHFKRHHVLKHLAVAMVFTLIGLWLLGWLSTQGWFYQGLGVEHTSNALALLLFMLSVPIFTQFMQPIGNWLSRRHEFEADDFAHENTGAEHLISALVKLYKENANTLTPDPLYSAYHDSHPPAPVRIAHLSSKTDTP
ncbi:MAG: M48 family metallopeptidase [Candidatus Sedimenticola sp. 6PFRAG7]